MNDSLPFIQNYVVRIYYELGTGFGCQKYNGEQTVKKKTKTSSYTALRYLMGKWICGW